ncbi:MAG TPA: DUF881 domain-containing protein [Bacilli bacterium]|nr:DUF881 domain-containing protein [Bacilli bacterium]
MNFRQVRTLKQRRQELNQIEDAIANLPKATPRPGLKHEMLHAILNDVRQEQEEAPKQRRLSWRIPPIGFSLSVAGMAVAVFVMLQSMHLPLPTPEEASGPLHHGAVPLSQAQLTKQVEQEIKARKEEREQRLQKQVIPHYNGQYVGEGIEIRVKNSASYMVRKSISPGDIEANFDIYRLVQEIYTNGGQIVSINGLLVDPYTQIVTKGTLTEVSERRVTYPLTIKVIGDSEALVDKFTGGASVLKELEDDQVISYEQKNLIAIDDETDKQNTETDR